MRWHRSLDCLTAFMAATFARMGNTESLHSTHIFIVKKRGYDRFSNFGASTQMQMECKQMRVIKSTERSTELMRLRRCPMISPERDHCLPNCSFGAGCRAELQSDHMKHCWTGNWQRFGEGLSLLQTKCSLDHQTASGTPFIAFFFFPPSKPN